MDAFSHPSDARARGGVAVHPRAGRGAAHGKAILFGEHAVLYGAPAIALPVAQIGVTAVAECIDGASRIVSAVYTGSVDAAPARLGPTVTALGAALERLGAADQGIRLQIDSDIPVARGLGSSAAVASAVVTAVTDAFGQALDEVSRFELVQAAERVAHGTPSGLDARSVVAIRPLWFASGQAQPLPVGAAASFVLIDTGVASGTREAVAAVRERHGRTPDEVDAIVDDLRRISIEARPLLADGDLDGLGAAMTRAHERLVALGVSSRDLDHLVHAARTAGALGAKLTGGGRGGCLVALARDAADAERLADAVRAAGAAAAWTTTVPAIR